MASWNVEHMLPSPSRPARSDHFSNLVARSNSAVTTTKSSTSKLRRHVKSEPVSCAKNIQESKTSSEGVQNLPKRPNYLPIQVHKSQITPGATDMRDLPGRRFTPSASQNPPLPMYSMYSNGHHGVPPPPTHSLTLEEENRQLRATVVGLREKTRNMDFLQHSFDRMQAEFSRLNELCIRKSQVDEKRIETLEAALKDMAIQQQHHQPPGYYSQQSPRASESDLRSSPNNTGSSLADLEDNRNRNPTQGDFKAALSSLNFLLKALSERDDEITSLKRRVRAPPPPPFGSDRSLDGGPGTPTYEYPRVSTSQSTNRTKTYHMEYVMYGNGGAPPQVMTPPYEFESITKPQPQPKPEVLGLKSI